MKCSSGIAIVVVLVAVAVGYVYLTSNKQGIIIRIEKDAWWSSVPPQLADNDTSIRPFQVRVDKEILQDLKVRLNRIRRYQTLDGIHWDYGTNAKYIMSLVDYWRKDYDWTKQEKIINNLDQYRTKIHGINIHFVHAKPRNFVFDNSTVKVILITHGWPGSFFEFYKVIPLLIDKGYVVVAPSIPGYGFSDAAEKPGLGVLQTASLFIHLMNRLGYDKYYVQGGDWGSAVSQSIASFDTKHCRGIHTNFNIMKAPNPILTYGVGSIFPSLVYPDPEERRRIFPVMERAMELLQEIGYFLIQLTKPDTIGFALNDSPLGLAAYITEKFVRWSGCSNTTKVDCIEDKFTKDELLTNIMIYWVTQSITSSMRYYKELLSKENIAIERIPVVIPAGIAKYPDEMFQAPRLWLSYRYKQIISYNVMPNGGHFPALEQPDLFVNNLLDFITKTEELYAKGKIILPPPATE